MNGKIGFINQVRTLTGNNLIPLGDQAIDREEKNPQCAHYCINVQLFWMVFFASLKM